MPWEDDGPPRRSAGGVRGWLGIAAGVVGLSAGWVACSGSPLTYACTDIGCANGLLLIFSSPPPAGTTVTLELSPTPWVVRCGVDVECSSGVFFSDLRVDVVEIRVENERGVTLTEVRPTYEETRPNGPDCPPTCYRSEVTVATPTG